MLRKKFVATEKQPFTKYPKICELEARHGVDLGISHLNKSVGRTFCHYTAKGRKENSVETLTQATYFSSDGGNYWQRQCLRWAFPCVVVWCWWCWWNIHTHMSYFTEDSPQDSTASFGGLATGHQVFPRGVEPGNCHRCSCTFWGHHSVRLFDGIHCHVEGTDHPQRTKY